MRDSDSYQKVVDRLRALGDLIAIHTGVAQADAGETRPALEALRELREKYGR